MMNSIRHGFYTDLPGLSGLHEMESLSDLRNYQELLARLHYRAHSAWCSCGSQGTRRELSVFRLPGSEILSLRCVDRAEHPYGECIFARSEIDTDDSKTVSDSIFRPVPAAPRQTTNVVQNRSEEGHADHFTFSRFASSILSEAFVGSISVSRSLGAATARIDVFVQAAQRALMRPRFKGGVNALDAAARHGVRVVLGVIESNLTIDGMECAPLTLRIWTGSILATETLLIQGAVWRDAVGEALVWGKLMRPPLLGVAVVDRKGLIVKMRVFAIFADGVVLAPAESEFERGYARFLAASDGMFLKPLLRRDVADFLRSAGLECPASFPFRPDFVVIYRSAIGARISIVEVRGIPMGKDSEYDLRLQFKRGYVEKLGPPFAYEELCGWNYPVVESHIEWSVESTDWMPPSPAVDEWLRRRSV